MRLIVTCEHRFSSSPDGSVWTKVAFDYAFWRRYLDDFDSVRIVARLAAAPVIDQTFRQVTGDGVEFWPIPFYLGPQQFLMRRSRIRQSLLEALDHNDALLCRVASPLADELLPTLWRTGRPYGLEVVGDPHESMGPRTIRHPLRRLFQARATHLLRRECSRAFAVAYVTRETLQKKYPSPAHSVGVSDIGQLDFSKGPKVFTTSYSSFSWGPEDFATKSRQFHLRERPRILFVGSLAQMYKGLDVLLKAVTLLVQEINPQVVIVGDGKHRLELERMAGRMGISRNVEFLGELPAGKQVREQLDRATLFVMPSRTEGLPRAMIEAMARGLPCIATRVGGIPELLADDDMIPSQDHVSLASKIRDVVSDPKRLSEMSQRNLQRAQEYRPEVLESRRRGFYRFLRQSTESWLTQTDHVRALTRRPS